MTRKTKDRIMQIITYFFSSFSLLVLLAVIIFVFGRGFKVLSFKFIGGDYNSTVINASKKPEASSLGGYSAPDLEEDEYFSEKWGIALKDSLDTEHNRVVVVSYLDNKSPLHLMKDNYEDDKIVGIKEEYQVNIISGFTEDESYIAAYGKDGAEDIVLKLAQMSQINRLSAYHGGGGIRGSIITTLLLIVMTLIIALPLGIGAAIFLNEYQTENKFTTILRSFIDMLTGVPSVIYGLVGATVFIPLSQAVAAARGPNVLAGAFTLAVIILPVIIKTTEEALGAIPDSFRSASLALGATRTQTVFKVVLPNAWGGIITAVVLAIGRIIGESAALIYVMGTTIQDRISVNSQSTSLSVHIWRLMSGESPNLDASCAISIIILVVVLILNLLTKLISKKLVKYH